MDTRQHHLQMKYLLAQMAIQDPTRFFATFGPDGGEAYLQDLWTAIGEKFPEEQRAPAEGAQIWRQSSPDLAVIVLILPAPAARNEAYFVGAVQPASGTCRVFCLERAVMPTTGEEFTMLSELAAEGRSSWGPGGAPTVEAFVSLIGRLVADPDARPLSFVPIRLGQ